VDRSDLETLRRRLRGRRGFVSGGRRNRISRERVFVKSYVQLDQSDSDPQFRSNILFIEHLAYPEYDRKHLVRFRSISLSCQGYGLKLLEYGVVDSTKVFFQSIGWPA